MIFDHSCTAISSIFHLRSSSRLAGVVVPSEKCSIAKDLPGVMADIREEDKRHTKNLLPGVDRLSGRIKSKNNEAKKYRKSLSEQARDVSRFSVIFAY